MGFSRNRSGFSIDPNYTGPDPNGVGNTAAIPYGVNVAVLDVDVEVADDIVIPSGKNLIVTTDPDIYNSPDSVQTFVGFNQGAGLTVQGGGYLVSTQQQQAGVVIWNCPSSANKGAWRGISCEQGAWISMQSSIISGAEVGLRMDRCNASSMEVLLVENSRDRGVHILDCGPEFNLLDVNNSGTAAGPVAGVNVRIEGTSSAVFRSSSMRNAVKLSGGNPYASGLGVWLTGTREVLFENCDARNNEGCGFMIDQATGPYILDSRVRDNAVGINVRRGSNWTTLRLSRVHGNDLFGVRLEGSPATPARLRGWYHPSPTINPNVPQDVDDILAVNEVEGLNCVYNNPENLRAEYSRYDLGSQYQDGGGNYVLLGHRNSIFDPAGPSQCVLTNTSYGGLMENWWDGNPAILAYPPATYDFMPELQNDEAGCTEMSKGVADASGSLVRDLLEYRRRRGGVATQETHAPSTQSVNARPSPFLLAEAYPNPAVQRTSISFSLFEGHDITLAVTDMLGRRVAVLAGGYHEAGRYTAEFQTGGLPSGLYRITLSGAGGVQSRSFLLTR